MQWIQPLEPRRLLATFSPDVAWGNDGLIDPGDTDGVRYIGRSDGRIYGRTWTDGDGGNPRVTLARYHADGTPDATFKTYVASDYNIAADVDAAGRMLIGSSTGYNDPTVFIARLTARGNRDRSFGPNGVVLAPPSPVQKGYPDTYVTQLIAQPDGSVYAALSASSYLDTGRTVYRRSLARLTPAGALDLSFGQGGYVDLGTDAAWSLSDDRRGRVYLQSDNAVYRLRVNGSRDTTFADRGRLGFDTATKVVLDTAGRLVAARNSDGDTLVTRYDTRGQADATFGNDHGTVAIVESVNSDLEIKAARSIRAVLPQSNGSLLLQLDQTIYSIDANGAVEPGTDVSTDRDAIVARQADGGYLTCGIYVFGPLKRLAPAQPAALGRSGTLYLRGLTADGQPIDRFTVRQAGTRVSIGVNDQTVPFDAAAVQRINADLGEGTNVFSSTLNVRTTVVSAGGNDRITTGGGNDSIESGNGHDTIVSGAGDDSIYPGGGRDAVDVGQGINSVSTDSEDNAGGRLRVVGSGGDLIVGVGNGVPADIDFTGRSASIYLGDADNLVRSITTGRTYVATGGGRDHITTGPGDDEVLPGPGNDNVTTGGGDDRIHYTDPYYAPPKVTDDDVYDLGTGNDRASDRLGSNLFQGGDGDDRIDGGSGRDTLIGGPGHDVLLGNNGDDSLTGDAGNHTLLGGAGDDTLRGGDGNDALYALFATPLDERVAHNLLDGGAGVDTAFLESDSDVLTSIESQP
jgi:uncharacterized delta-60 repeat protein